MGRPYTGWDGNATGRRAGLEKLVDLLEEHFGVFNNGTFGIRNRFGQTATYNYWRSQYGLNGAITLYIQ